MLEKLDWTHSIMIIFGLACIAWSLIIIIAYFKNRKDFRLDTISKIFKFILLEVILFGLGVVFIIGEIYYH